MYNRDIKVLGFCYDIRKYYDQTNWTYCKSPYLNIHLKDIQILLRP